jgi:predicted thioredoxin/glutaredoxin
MILLTTKSCPSCYVIKNMIKKEDNISIIDLHEAPELSTKYGIMSVPVLIDDEGNQYKTSLEIIKKIKSIND